MVKRHFNVARIQGLTSIISFNQIIKVAESSVNINCKITILSNKINALLKNLFILQVFHILVDFHIFLLHKPGKCVTVSEIPAQ